MYAAGRAHRYKAPCRRMLEAVARGDVEAITDTEVIQEIAYRYHAIGRPEGLALAEEFLGLMPVVLPVTRADLGRSLELQRRYPSLRPRDAIHIAVMLEAGVNRILTADRHFDEVSEVERVDPADLRWGAR
jgi:predicted nucleic acid-binding protein